MMSVAKIPIDYYNNLRQVGKGVFLSLFRALENTLVKYRTINFSDNEIKKRILLCEFK